MSAIRALGIVWLSFELISKGVVFPLVSVDGADFSYSDDADRVPSWVEMTEVPWESSRQALGSVKPLLRHRESTEAPTAGLVSDPSAEGQGDGGLSAANAPVRRFDVVAYEDINCSDHREPEESVVAGVLVEVWNITADGRKSGDRPYATGTTSAGGVFRFTVPAVDYLIIGVPSDGLYSPANGKVSRYDPAILVPTVEIPYYPFAEVSGRVYQDDNQSGTREPAESGIPGVQVTLRGPNLAERSLLTGEDGSYLFENVEPAEFDLGMSLGSCWRATTATNVTIHLSCATPSAFHEFGMTPVPPPSVSVVPAELFLAFGEEGILEAQVTGATDVSYQWMKNGVPIADQQGPRLRLVAGDLGDSGLYRVKVQSLCGAAESSEVEVKTLEHLPYVAWARDRAIPLVEADPGDDPDEDGMVNLVEFVLGTSPTQPEARHGIDLTFFQHGARRMAALEFARSRAAESVNLLLQASEDLKSWRNLSSDLEILSRDVDGDRVRLVDSARVPWQRWRFLRLAASWERPIAPSPTLSVVRDAQGTAMRLDLRGEPGVLYTIQWSSDLLEWHDLQEIGSEDGMGSLDLSRLPDGQDRFFRAIPGPPLVVPSLRVERSSDAGQGVVLSLRGDRGQGYLIQWSEDLRTWQPLRQVTVQDSVVVLTDSPPEGSRLRYYRAIEGVFDVSPTLTLVPPLSGAGPWVLKIQGETGSTYTIQWSQDLRDWHYLRQVTLNDDGATLADLPPPGDRPRFFRAVRGAVPPPFRLELLPSSTASGPWTLRIHGEPGKTYGIEWSEDLRTWRRLLSVKVESSPVLVTDSTPSMRSQRFYRLVEADVTELAELTLVPSADDAHPEAFLLSLLGRPWGVYAIEWSSDLVHWYAMTNVTANADGRAILETPLPAGGMQGFLRASLIRGGLERPRLTIERPSRGSDSITLVVEGTVDGNPIIQWSEDLRTWRDLGAVTMVGGRRMLSERIPAGGGRRFYRLFGG